MKDRSVLILFICVFVLGTFIVVQEYFRAKTSSQGFKRLILFDIDPATLTSMEFKGTNSVVDCAIQNGIWMVGNPERGMGRADVAKLSQMVAHLNSLGKGITITPKELETRGLKASDYGFNPPSMEIEAVDNHGRRVWQVGRTTPLGKEVYIRKSGSDDIYTVLSALLRFVPTNPDQLRNHLLFTEDAAAIKRLEIRGPGGFLRIVRESANQWRIQQPGNAQADPLEISTYIGKLYKLRIEDFIAENVSDLSVYGLQGEAKQISLGYADGSSRTLVLGDKITGRAGFIYARRADDTSVFALKEDALQLLDIPENHFRDARVITIPKDEISSVLIKRGDEQLAMSENEKKQWMISSPTEWLADPAAVANLISLWNHAVITDFDVATNSAASDWVLEFASKKAAQTNRVDVLPAGDRKDGLFVRLNNGPALFQINLPSIPESIINPLVYKDKHVWDLKKKDVNKLILQRADQPKEVLELSPGGTFVATESNGNAQVDTKAVNRLLDKLSNLTTSGYITYNPRNLDIYGLTKPSVELYVGLLDSNELGRVLLIGRESTDGYYSMVKGRNVVFYLDKATVNSISSDLVLKPAESAQPAE